MKKWFWIIFILILAGNGIFLYQTTPEKYTIEDSLPSIEAVMEDRLEQPIDIREQVKSGDRWFVLFETDKTLGMGEFVQGKNGKYAVEVIGHGSKPVRQSIIETSEGLYLLVAGKNEQQVARIDAKIEHLNYDIKLDPEAPYFLTLTPINGTQRAEATSLSFYDQNGKELELKY